MSSTPRRSRTGWWRRWLSGTGAVALVVPLGVVTAIAAAPEAAAQPLPAPYSATASADVARVNSAVLGATLADVDLVHGDASVNSTTTPASRARSGNLGAQVGPISAGITNTTVAPPNATQSGSLLNVGLTGPVNLSTGVVTYTDTARWDGATTCAPVGVPLSRSVTGTAGAGLNLLGISVLNTGAVTTTTTTSLTQTSATRDTRGVTSSSAGNVAGLSILDGAVAVSALQPTLSTTATSGGATSATLSSPSAVTVSLLGGAPAVLVPGVTTGLVVPGVANVSLRLASNADVVNSGGTFSTSFLRVDVELLGVLGASLGEAHINVLPLSVNATAPAGGVECDTTAPAVAITAPANGSTVRDLTPAITGTSELSNSSVSLSLDGGAAVTVPTNAAGNWSYTPPSPLSEASHTAVVTATDPAGNSSTATSTFTVDVLPTIDIQSPPEGADVATATPVVSGTSNVLNGTVSVTVDSLAPVSVPTGADGTWSYTTPTLLDGPHQVTASATDAQGNTVNDQVSFTVDTVNPAIQIVTPEDGSSTQNTRPPITGASRTLNGTVGLVIDGGAPISRPTNGTGAWSYTPPTALDQGPHVVVASTAIVGGGTATDTAAFTVDSVAPTVAITAPADGAALADTTPTVTGTSDVLDGEVTLVIDGDAPVTVTTDGTGAWSYTPVVPLAQGPHRVQASATDAAGNIGVDAVDFTVDTTDPTVAIVTPADGSTTASARPPVSGTSDVISGAVSLVVDGNAAVSVPTDNAGNWSYTPTADLAEGPHTATVTATDAAGNTATAESGFTVDTTAPAVAITTPAPNAALTDTTPTIAGTSDITNGSISLVIDGGAAITVPTGATGAWTYTPATPLGEGLHTATATATDPSGTSSASVSFSVDTTAPEVAITTPTDGSSVNASPVPISGTSDVLDGTVSLVVDGAAPVSVPTSVTGAWTYAATLAEGPHTATVTATDAAGNTATDEVSFTVDRTAPTVDITAPTDGASLPDGSVTVTGTSDVLNGTLDVRVDGAAPVQVTTDGAGDWSFPTTLDEGPHTVTVIATDGAGNESADEVTFTIDTTAPAVTITAPADGSSLADTTPTISGTSDVVNGSISLVIDGGAPITVSTNGTGAWTYTPATPLSEAEHTVTATATDAAGNVTTDEVTFTVDTTAPEVTITEPTDGAALPDGDVIVRGTSDVVDGEISLVVDGGTPVTVTTNDQGDWSYATTLDEGEHTITATATDDAGNDTSDSVTVTVDTTAPAVAITAPADGATLDDAAVTVTGTSDVLDGTLSVSVDGGTPVDVPTNATGGWTYPTTLGDGPHTVTATATDAAGNDTTDEVTFTVDTTAPTVTITSPADGTATADPAVTVRGQSDVVNGTISLVLDGAAPVTVTTNAAGDWSYATTLGEGEHTATATATDAAGNTGTDSVTFTVDTVAPGVAITAPVDGSSLDDTAVTVTGTSGVLDGSISLVIDGGAPVSVTTDATGGWSYPTTLGEGDHTVTATATDQAGNESVDEASFTVDTTSPAIAITSPANGSSTADTTPAITGTSGVASGTISLVLDGGAPITVSTTGTGAWTYTPTTPLDEGEHTATATATDGAGNSASASSTFTVDTTDPTVAVTEPGAGDTVTDSTPTITGTSDLPDREVTVVVDGDTPVTVPTDGDGDWTYTPTTPLGDGDHTVVVTATDDAGNEGTDEVTFTVDTTPPGVAIVEPADGGTVGDSTPTVSGTSQVPDGEVTVVVDGGTPVTVPTDGDGDWTYTPTTPLDDGDHTVVVTATDDAGNESTDEVTFTVDTTPPIITVTSPEDGGEVNDPTPPITGTSDLPDSEVIVTVGDQPPVTVPTDGDGNWTHTPTTPLPDGEHEIVVEGTDEGGNTTTVQILISVNTDVPEIDIVRPADGSTVEDTTPTISGTSSVTDGTIQLGIDEPARDPDAAPALVGPAALAPAALVAAGVPTDADGNWTYTPTTPLAAGEHTVQALATDDDGDTATDEHTFTVVSVPPTQPGPTPSTTVTITSPTDGSDVTDRTPTIQGTATPAGSRVVIRIGGNVVGETVSDVDGRWSFTPTSNVACGNQTITATATGPGGAVSRSIDVTVDCNGSAPGTGSDGDLAFTGGPGLDLPIIALLLVLLGLGLRLRVRSAHRD